MTDPIQPAVRAVWPAWNAPLEGRVSWMYPDTEGLVTTGEGDLLATAADAQALPWQHPDGTPATSTEIAAEWLKFHGNMTIAVAGAWVGAKPVATLFLADPALDDLVQSAEEADAATLMATPEFAGFPGWPADAQLGLLSMGWAMGPGFAEQGRWPHFRAACAAQDWGAAAANCEMEDVGGPITRRNNATALAFKLAANPGIDPSVLAEPDTWIVTAYIRARLREWSSLWGAMLLGIVIAIVWWTRSLWWPALMGGMGALGAALIALPGRLVGHLAPTVPERILDVIEHERFSPADRDSAAEPKESSIMALDIAALEAWAKAAAEQAAIESAKAGAASLATTIAAGVPGVSADVQAVVTSAWTGIQDAAAGKFSVTTDGLPFLTNIAKLAADLEAKPVPVALTEPLQPAA